MSEGETWLRSDGTLVTEAEIQALADEAERGYEVDPASGRRLWYWGRYTQEGALAVETQDGLLVDDLGWFDADGGEWTGPVEAMLLTAGWQPLRTFGFDPSPEASRFDGFDAALAVIRVRGRDSRG